MKKARQAVQDKIRKEENEEMVKDKRSGRGKAAPAPAAPIKPMDQEEIPSGKKTRGASKDAKAAVKEEVAKEAPARANSRGKKAMDDETTAKEVKEAPAPVPATRGRRGAKSKDKEEPAPAKDDTDEEEAEPEEEKKGGKGKKANGKKEPAKKADEKKDAKGGKKETKKGAGAEEVDEWVVKTIEDKLTPAISAEILGLLDECIKQELVSYKGEDDTGFDDIGNEKEKQNIEKRIGTALRKRLNKGAGQRMNVVIGESFVVRLTNLKDFGVFSIGPVKVYVFGAVRASGKG